VTPRSIIAAATALNVAAIRKMAEDAMDSGDTMHPSQVIAALDRVEALETRQQELLATIRNLSSSVPYAEEAGNAATLIAEVGTLKARVVEWKREASSAMVRAATAENAAADYRAERDTALSRIALLERLLAKACNFIAIDPLDADFATAITREAKP
jgi:predicted  nucleic acid-binding Zn-ribbon protein